MGFLLSPAYGGSEFLLVSGAGAYAGARDEHALKHLEGFRYRQALIGPADEAALLARVRELPFQEFDFHP